MNTQVSTPPSAAADTPVDPKSQRILTAALARFSARGLRAVTVDSVARAARVDRATLYRRYAGKDDLVRAVALHRLRQLLCPGPPASTVQGFDDHVLERFTTAILRVREEPLFRRIVDQEPEALLPVLVSRDGAAIGAVSQLLLATDPRLCTTLAGNAPAAAELLVRLALSLLTAESGHTPAHTSDEVRAWARAAVLPIIHCHLPASPTRPTTPADEPACAQRPITVAPNRNRHET